ncbi:MAG: DUF2147 domain-containing protein [Acidobacteriota bacterium]
MTNSAARTIDRRPSTRPKGHDLSPRAVHRRVPERRGWRRWILSGLAVGSFVLTLLALPSPVAAQDPVLGTWLTEEGEAKVRLKLCSGELCGFIVWLRDPLDESGQPDLDNLNPIQSLRHRPILGLRMVHSFPPEPDRRGRYTGGKIYDPDSGRTYSATITPKGPNRLQLRGFVGISLLGRTTIWTRVEEEPSS